MKLFKTTSRRTYHRPQAKRGWSTTLTAKTRLKRWAKRSRKKLWRKAKAQTKRTWRKLTPKRQARKRQIARNAQRFQQHHAEMHTAGGYQVDASGGVSYQPGPAQVAGGQAKLPPPDGAMANCRRCSNEVQYNGGRERWEHTGRGNAECFQSHR